MSDKILLLYTFIQIGFSNIAAQTMNNCNDSLNYKTVQSRWNQKIKNVTIGSWKLRSTDINLKNDSTIITQSLDGPSLYFVATVLKTGCVRRVTIKAKRDIDIGYASLVAWLAVVNVFNPELSTVERKKVLDDLKITDEISFFNSSTTRGNNIYYFQEALNGNTFTVVTKN